VAGIGFRLQHLLRTGTYRGLVAAYGYAAFITAGPWLLSICAIYILSLAAAGCDIGRGEALLFRTIVVYTYAGTLILTGLIQMATTRHIADRLYVNDVLSIAPCYQWMMIFVSIASGLLAGIFYATSGKNMATTLASIALFQLVAINWLGMVFLSAAQDYLAIGCAYLIGLALSVGMATAGGCIYGLAGLLWGFVIGQAALVALLGVRIRVEFPSNRGLDSGVLHRWRETPYLAAVGFFYNLGIWIDKILFWHGPRGHRLDGWLYIAPEYDTCMFLGYLTVVPALALFLIRVETGFYKHYAAFFGSVGQGGDLRAIMQVKRNMANALRLSAARLLKLQGLVTFGAWLAAPYLAHAADLPLYIIPLLRLGILASFLQALLLLLLVILLYFDWQAETAALAALFAACNAVFTSISFFLPEQYTGMGYLCACLFALVAGLAVLERRFAGLEYETFAKQPLLS